MTKVKVFVYGRRQQQRRRHHRRRRGYDNSSPDFRHGELKMFLCLGILIYMDATFMHNARLEHWVLGILTNKVCVQKMSKSLKMANFHFIHIFCNVTVAYITYMKQCKLPKLKKDMT